MKKIKKVLSILLVMALATSLMTFSASAAEPAVVFDAAKGEFNFKDGEGILGIFKHTEENAHEHPQNPDLFPDMKNAFPGDEFTQEIKLKVENVSGKRVKLFLRAELPNDDYLKLFDVVLPEEGADEEEPSNPEVAQLQEELKKVPTLTVKYGEEEYSAGYLGQTIELGTFKGSKKDAQIDVILSIPLEAGNELQGMIAEVDWVFTAEVTSSGGGGGGGGEEPPIVIPDEETPLAPGETPEEPPVEIPDEEPPLAELPQTGLLQWPILVMGLAGLLLIALGILSEQKRKARN